MSDRSSGEADLFTYTPYGANARGDPVFRVVADRLQVLYVTVPRKRSDTATVEATIAHALAARARPPKPVR